MDFESYRALFNIQGKNAVITGGSGVLGRAMALGLAQAGARIAVVSRRQAACEHVAAEIRRAGGQAFAVACDVTERAQLERAAENIAREFGPADILINAAGGNQPGASTSATQSFFDLDTETLTRVLNLNVNGTLFACQVFGRGMAERKEGIIVNIASMSANRPLTRVVAYSVAKAAVTNFTQWLAVYMAQEYSPQIRVNALAPGFFLTEQNRYLLIDKDSGAWTERGAKIIAHTPMARLGNPADLVGTLLWLVSPASSFVTGVIVPVDGGFGAFSGV
ncbi:MAG TPA: SDR family oxidoreductase [Anaerolineae bacterium]